MKKLKTIGFLLVALISSFFFIINVKAYLIDNSQSDNTFTVAPAYDVTLEYYYIDDQDNNVEYQPPIEKKVFKGTVYNLMDDIIDELDYSEVRHYLNGNLYSNSTYTVLGNSTIASVYMLNRYNVLFTYSYVDEFDQKHELKDSTTASYNKGREIALRSNLENIDYSSVDYVINDSAYLGDTYAIQGTDTIEEIYNLTRYNIVYDLDGGTLADSNPTVYTSRTENITLNNPSKIGFVFKGWTGSNGLTPEDPVVIYSGTTGDLNYVANYNQMTSDITITVSDEQIETLTKMVSIAYTVNYIDPDEVITEYSIDNGNSWVEYTEPFEISKNYKIQVRTKIIENDYVIGTAEKQITNITIITANLVDGQSFNRILKELSGQAGGGAWNENYTITAIRRSETEPTNYGSAQRISNQWNSPVDVWAWYDNGVIYYYTTADKLFVDNAMSMFAKFKALTTIDMISELDTSHAISMQQMFEGDSSLTSLDLSSWDTSNVTTMLQMFDGCSGLRTIDLSSFNTSNVDSMFMMFANIGVEELDLSSFDTHLIVDMNQMFANLPNLRILNISSFDTSNVTSMYQMFYNDTKLEQIIFGEDFKTGSVTNMYQMFQGCSSITELDLSSFDTSNVQSMGAMFMGMTNLQTIYVYDDFDSSSLTGSWNMFAEDLKLVGEMGTSLATTGNVTDVTYAKIDNQWQQGYFTRKRRT
jgi:uncharacterized repeat protein (TIGR02543 family)